MQNSIFLSMLTGTVALLLLFSFCLFAVFVFRLVQFSIKSFFKKEEATTKQEPVPTVIKRRAPRKKRESSIIIDPDAVQKIYVKKR